MRRLGQHFLADPRILGRIADAVEIEPGETVLEIGPGKGSLTEALLERGAKVIAIEKDRRLAAELEREGLSVIQGDALKTEWPRVAKIVGNIPYYITSPLIEKALTPPLPERVVFLVQAEVAERLPRGPEARRMARCRWVSRRCAGWSSSSRSRRERSARRRRFAARWCG